MHHMWLAQLVLELSVISGVKGLRIILKNGVRSGHKYVLCLQCFGMDKLRFVTLYNFVC